MPWAAGLHLALSVIRARPLISAAESVSSCGRARRGGSETGMGWGGDETRKDAEQRWDELRRPSKFECVMEKNVHKGGFKKKKKSRGWQRVMTAGRWADRMMDDKRWGGWKMQLCTLWQDNSQADGVTCFIPVTHHVSFHSLFYVFLKVNCTNFTHESLIILYLYLAGY